MLLYHLDFPSLLTVYCTRTIIHGTGTVGNCIHGNIVIFSQGRTCAKSHVSKSTLVVKLSFFFQSFYVQVNAQEEQPRLSLVTGPSIWMISVYMVGFLGAVPGFSILSFAAATSDYILISESGGLLFVISQPIKMKRYFLGDYGLLFLPRCVSLPNVLFKHSDALNVLWNT